MCDDARVTQPVMVLGILFHRYSIVISERCLVYANQDCSDKTTPMPYEFEMLIDII